MMMLTVFVFVIKVMIVVMIMRMAMILVIMAVTVLLVVLMCEVNIKFDAFDARFLLASDMQMIAMEIEFREFALELIGIHPKIDHCANEHVAADAAKNIKVKSLHNQQTQISRIRRPSPR